MATILRGCRSVGEPNSRNRGMWLTAVFKSKKLKPMHQITIPKELNYRIKVI